MQIGILGTFEVRGDDGVAIEVPGARLRGVLVALALRPGQVVPKSSLVEWVWGEQPPGDASNALQRLVSRLRRVLPGGVIEGGTDGYRLRVLPEDVDAVRFEQLMAGSRNHVRPGEVLREALGLWRGPALHDVDLTGSAPFDAALTRLEQLRLGAVEDWARAEEPGPALVSELTGLVAAHPLREPLAAALMRALAGAGRGSEALLVYERTRQALADELGADPSAELSALHLELLRGTPPPRKAAPRTARRHNLRAELTSFIGREHDLAQVRELLGRHRLVTLIGPGGAGKTRLAVESARPAADDLPDGAWLVELAPVTAGGDVAPAALAALGLRDTMLGEATGDSPRERLVAAVRDREMLLVLDNCEHVIEQVAALAHQLLGECPRLRVLATSREVLGLTGETLWPVVPLNLPAEQADPDQIGSSPAVRLLCDRALAVRPGLVLDASTAGTMARIARALDGMPLAIELAAARLRTMTPEQLASRLDDRFRLLTGGSRAALPRHRTLRAVIDWSWQLLTGPEQLVLRRLSVLPGGATLEAAEWVCRAGEAPDVLDLLTALTEKSLLVTEDTAGPRYRMLGTVREYSAQRLAEAGEETAARQALLAYVTDLAETADPQLRRRDQLLWLERLGAEHDNVSAAMRDALAAGDAAGAMRLAAAAGWYWWLSGHRAEGNTYLTAAAGLEGAVPDGVRAMVYALVSTFLSSGRNDERDAAQWIHQAHELASRTACSSPLLELTAPLEVLLTAPQEYLSAFEPLLASDDPWVRALARLQLGKLRIMHGHGGLDADAHLATALAEFQALGERFGISFARTELADRLAVRGDLAGACEHYEQAVTAVTEIGALDDVIRMRARQAQLYRLMGDPDAAAAALAEARRCARKVTWPEALAELALAEAELARWDDDPGEVLRRLDVVHHVLGEAADAPNLRAARHDLLGYLATDLEQARAHRAAACAAAAESGIPPVVAQVLVGVADLALRMDRPDQAARLLGAGVAMKGLTDRSHPDLARIEDAARRRLGEELFAETTREGRESDWTELTGVTLAG
ncbi:winged helix-turn-helix domain-containing protein [Kineosporia sp. J2-2]|uniref:Winged helix-turn-helix domain-containing protein n=1 Tax=Kineosporia corallincola TaxID=2835133 RepID=A0ABS5TQA9_9ACTN|nr:BTAD domain-containing putative transcriptional regulator [Kineosporia corallincola]MBT0773297.1 winged helix-turn-helix domain-containing protein [Kineosporia corallincola]